MSNMNMSPEIAMLRTEMNARMAALEDCLSRITNAMEKLSENRERLIVLEVKFRAELDSLHKDVTDMRGSCVELRDAVKGLSKENSQQTLSITRLEVVKGGALAIAGALLAMAVKGMFPGLAS